jgi:3-hydroxyacyl-[acyl-carrier-protein] dehydratase
VAQRSVERWLRADDPSADGHFPGNPIIPGAVLLREVLSAVSADAGTICHEIRAAKFLHPVRPGDCLAIAWEERADGEIGFTCSTGAPATRVLMGTLRVRPR